MAMDRKIRRALKATTALTALPLLAFSQSALANPKGGVVAAGEARITEPNSTTVHVNQSTDKAIIDWQSFNIESQRDHPLLPAQHLLDHPQPGHRQPGPVADHGHAPGQRHGHGGQSGRHPVRAGRQDRRRRAGGNHPRHRQ
jgi:hypothetical protein